MWVDTLKVMKNVKHLFIYRKKVIVGDNFSEMSYKQIYILIYCTLIVLILRVMHSGWNAHNMFYNVFF